jgi:hypothetical protein
MRNMKFISQVVAVFSFGLSLHVATAREASNDGIEAFALLFEYSASDVKGICSKEFQQASDAVHETYLKELLDSTKLTNDMIRNIMSSSSSVSLRGSQNHKCYVEVGSYSHLDEATLISLKECSMVLSEQDALQETETSGAEVLRTLQAGSSCSCKNPSTAMTSGGTACMRKCGFSSMMANAPDGSDGGSEKPGGSDAGPQDRKLAVSSKLETFGIGYMTANSFHEYVESSISGPCKSILGNMTYKPLVITVHNA